MIFYKWLAFGARDSSQAPSILLHFINMFVMQGKDIAPLYTGQVSLSSRNMIRWTVQLNEVCVMLIPDRAADFFSGDSYAVGSCAAVRKTSLLVLAVSWRERPAPTQSKFSQKYWYVCSVISICMVTLSAVTLKTPLLPHLRVMRGWGVQVRMTVLQHNPMKMMKRRDLMKWPAVNLFPKWWEIYQEF